MAAPTVDSVARAAQRSQGAGTEYVKAYWFWVKLGPVEGAKAMGRAQIDFIKLAQKGSVEFNKAFQRSMNV